MSKENKEPLLPKSPPSPVMDNKWLGVVETNTNIVIIHHWSEYDQGTHKIHEIEISNFHRVLDIIIQSIHQFYPDQTDPNQFSLRIADKSGKPKTSMPVLDIGQMIYDTGIVRFALCNKSLDIRKSEKFEKLDDTPADKEPPKTIQNVLTEPTKTNLEQRGKKNPKKKICCCFYSD